MAADRMSIREALAGETILITGGAGFLGKVLLALLLCEAPQIERVVLVLRETKGATARARLERIFAESPALEPVRAMYGTSDVNDLPMRIEAYPGDVTKPRLGLAPEHVEALSKQVSIVVSLAAELGYTAPLNVALATNVAGPFEAASLARGWGAGLVHVSTCFVAPSSVETLQERPVRLEGSTATEEWRRARAASDDARRASPGRRAQIDAALRRARAGGWPNTYAYTKWLGESVLFEQFADVPLTVVRPSIVESARSFPMPGWNEDFKSTAPLAWMLGGWFRAVPARPGQLLDIIPVDDVARVLAVACAAVAERSHHPVYHAATGAHRPLTVERAARYVWSSAAPEGAPAAVRALMERSGVVVQDEMLSSLVSVPRRIAAVSEKLTSAGQRWPGLSQPLLRRAADFVKAAQRAVERRVRIVETYRPFTHDRAYAFACDRVFEHEPVEPAFRFAPETLDWEAYWHDVHLPGLRRWCFPSLVAGA